MRKNHRITGGYGVAVVVPVALLLGASTALAADPFHMLAFEAGGGLDGISGLGFSTSTGGFYNRLGGANTDLDSSDPTVWTESSSNHVAYDSYFAMSGGGPSRSNASETGESLTPQIIAFYQSFGITYANSYFDASGGGSQILGPGSHIGGTGDDDGQTPFPVGKPVEMARAGYAVSPPEVAAQSSPLGFGVFLGQFTLARGAELTGGMSVTLQVSPGQTSMHDLALNGASVVFETAPGVFQDLFLRSYLVAQNEDLSHSRGGGNRGIGNGNSQRFGSADVYHVWVEAVPAPGTAAMLGAVGLAMMGRRRRLA